MRAVELFALFAQDNNDDQIFGYICVGIIGLIVVGDIIKAFSGGAPVDRTVRCPRCGHAEKMSNINKSNGRCPFCGSVEFG